MYKYILLLFCVTSVISCKKDTKQQESLYSLLDVKEDEQYFSIPFDSTITVKGRKGTEITLHSSDFELNGSDDLELLLIELQDPMDFVMHNAQTVSDNTWLSSGGSYYIEVTQDGIAVPLKNDHTLKVRFPKITEQSMELFKGQRLNNGNMNWSELNISLDYDEYETFLIRDTIVLDNFNTYKYGVDIYIELPIIENKGLMSRNNSEQLFNRFKVDTILTLNDTLIGIDTVKEYVYSETGPTDTIENPTLYTRDISVKEIRRLLKNQNDISNTIDNLRTTWRIQSQNLNSLLKKQLLLYKEIELVTQGWINVDRFNVFEFNEEATLTVTNENYIQYLYVVFDRTKTIVKLSIPFKKTIDIPVNEPFALIGFNVLENGDLMGYKHKMKLNSDIDLHLELEKITISEIKSWLYQE